MNTTIESQWEIFRDNMLKDISQEELGRAKICFFAGATSLISMQRKLFQKDISEKEAALIFQNWTEEVSEFGKLLIEAVQRTPPIRH